MKKTLHISTLGLLLGAALGGCAVPQSIQAPAGEVAVMTVAAHGVQIYECRAGASGGPAWAFVAPEAELFDASGRHVGQHGAGPSWRHVDGSGFTGAVRSRADAPSHGAIAWLLLSARPEAAQGAFSRVSSVQRVNTVGGLPPGEGCTSAAISQRVRMGYRADYVLLAPGR